MRGGGYGREESSHIFIVKTWQVWEGHSAMNSCSNQVMVHVVCSSDVSEGETHSNQGAANGRVDVGHRLHQIVIQ